MNLSAFVNLISLNRSLIDVEPLTNCLFDILEEMRTIFGECHRKSVTCCSASIEFRLFVQLEDKHATSFKSFVSRGGGALQLHLYGGVWSQDWKIDPSAD